MKTDKEIIDSSLKAHWNEITWKRHQGYRYFKDFANMQKGHGHHYADLSSFLMMVIQQARQSERERILIWLRSFDVYHAMAAHEVWGRSGDDVADAALKTTIERLEKWLRSSSGEVPKKKEAKQG